MSVSIICHGNITHKSIKPARQATCRFCKKTKLEALGERSPPWPRQIITPILSTVKMLSLRGERLTPKVLDHYLYHNLVMLLLLWHLFFAHLLILEYLDHHQNFISSSLYYPGLLHKISSQSILNFLSNVHKQTDKPTLQKT